MAKVLLVERDPVLAAAIEDVFRAAGHRVGLVSDPVAAAAAAGEGGADALVIETGGGAGALDAVRTLRRQPETRDLPVVLIDGGGAPGRPGTDRTPLDRLGALRAGASDLLSHPFDPEELLLRLERLIEGGGAAPALSGDLGSDPLPELIQYLEHMGRSGELLVRGSPRSGRVRFEAGRAVEVSCGPLTGAEALLTLLEVDHGRFRFAARPAGGGDRETAVRDRSKALPTMSLLLFASWMRDELEHRRRLLPATGEPLRLTGSAAPTPEEEFARLPVVEVMAQIGSRSGSRLYDLVESIPAPPRAVRLAVAWLIEHGAVASAGEEREEAFPTTREIDGALLLELAVDELRTATAESASKGGAAPFLLLAEEGAWPDLLGLFERLPKSGRVEPFRDLGGQLRQRHGGSARLDAEGGRVVLHVQAISETARLQIGSLVPQCAGMVIWLDRGQAEAAVRAAVEHLQEMTGEPSGVLIAASPEAASLAERLGALNSRWATTPHPPRSLLAVLRLLRERP